MSNVYKAEMRMMRNDIVWDFHECIETKASYCEYFRHKWWGYNDANWWDNVSEKKRIVKVTGDKGTTLTFKINFHTCEVEQIGAEE